LNYPVFQRYLEYLERLGLIVELPGEDARLELSAKGGDAYRFWAEGLGRIFSGSVGPGTVP
jgi:predicted transcriptional regulator